MHGSSDVTKENKNRNIHFLIFIYKSKNGSNGLAKLYLQWIIQQSGLTSSEVVHFYYLSIIERT